MDGTELQVVTAADRALVDDVTDLVDRVARPSGRPGLSEARRRALGRAVDGRGHGFVAVAARRAADGRLVAYAQFDDEGDRTATSGELLVPTSGAEGAALADRLLDAAVDRLRAAGAAHLRLWVSHAGPDDDARARAHGLAVERDLLQLRCPLPLVPPGPGEVVVDTRPFVVGRDEAAWLDVNNRAFAGHPEQGGWELATIEAREAESWFDPDGFRVVDVDGRLAGSCWTKVHRDVDPPLGEIYVISVDPDVHGRGLGRGLARAGLDWLASVGIGTGMLYVDGANAAALGLYGSLGFEVHHVDRSYVGDLAATGRPAP